jgi:hypothetical protein
MRTKNKGRVVDNFWDLENIPLGRVNRVEHTRIEQVNRNSTYASFMPK